MTKLDSIALGDPCWIDLMTSDIASTRAFYTGLFGWQSDEPNEEFGGYVNFTREGRRIAGVMGNPGDGVPDVWSTYLAVEDANASCRAVEAAGGAVMVPAMEVGTLGAMAVVTDVGGAAIGMWQPGEHKGFGAAGEPGAPGWFELLTRSYEPTLAFYRDAFGWDLHTLSDEPEFRYTTLHGEEAVAGIMDAGSFLPEGVPAHWAVYFAVADTDTSAARVVELGGSIEAPPEDTPYGRVATVVDPTGARFKITAPVGES